MSQDPEQFEEFMKKLFAKMTRSMDDGMPDSDCPEDHDRSVIITDDEALLCLQELEHYAQEGERLSARVRTMWYQCEITKSKLFERLESISPEIRFPKDRKPGESTANTGWRYWSGKPYYVAHDKRSRDKDGKTEEERGQK